MDRPLWAQYVDWLRADRDRATSASRTATTLPAWQIIRPLLPVTLELAVLATSIAVLLGVPTGVISAVRQDTALDYALRDLLASPGSRCRRSGSAW